ncbi:hypothetical protein MKS88_001724 [Plasmodium brasilianum]|uniref:Uncharacterized protein n=1 Tax=Plasmodium brasilianum TaxID=5824 RepID=A0ACB9YC40_PLABR|nr:hypothetical protein MKS88_001724 [Plasmodium brasilianum]
MKDYVLKTSSYIKRKNNGLISSNKNKNVINSCKYIIILILTYLILPLTKCNEYAPQKSNNATHYTTNVNEIRQQFPQSLDMFEEKNCINWIEKFENDWSYFMSSLESQKNNWLQVKSKEFEKWKNYKENKLIHRNDNFDEREHNNNFFKETLRPVEGNKHLQEKDMWVKGSQNLTQGNSTFGNHNLPQEEYKSGMFKEKLRSDVGNKQYKEKDKCVKGGQKRTLNHLTFDNHNLHKTESNSSILKRKTNESKIKKNFSINRDKQFAEWREALKDEPTNNNGKLDKVHDVNESKKDLNELNGSKEKLNKLNGTKKDSNELSEIKKDSNKLSEITKDSNKLRGTKEELNKLNRTKKDSNKLNETKKDSNELSETTKDSNKLSETTKDSNKLSGTKKALEEKEKEEEELPQVKGDIQGKCDKMLKEELKKNEDNLSKKEHNINVSKKSLEEVKKNKCSNNFLENKSKEGEKSVEHNLTNKKNKNDSGYVLNHLKDSEEHNNVGLNKFIVAETKELVLADYKNWLGEEDISSFSYTLKKMVQKWNNTKFMLWFRNLLNNGNEEFSSKEWNDWLNRLEMDWADLYKNLESQRETWFLNKDKELKQWIKDFQFKWLHYRKDIDEEYNLNFFKKVLKWNDKKWVKWIIKEGKYFMLMDMEKWLDTNKYIYDLWLLKEWEQWKEKKIINWILSENKCSEYQYWLKWEYSNKKLSCRKKTIDWYKWKKFKRKESKLWQKWVSQKDIIAIETKNLDWIKWEEAKKKIFFIMLNQYIKNWIRQKQWNTWIQDLKMSV